MLACSIGMRACSRLSTSLWPTLGSHAGSRSSAIISGAPSKEFVEQTKMVTPKHNLFKTGYPWDDREHEMPRAIGSGTRPRTFLLMFLATLPLVLHLTAC